MKEHWFILPAMMPVIIGLIVALKKKRNLYYKKYPIIYGAINEKGEQRYTQMSKVFDAIDNKQKEFNWLITDVDGVPSKISYNDKDYCWITGEELSQIVQEDDRPWIWGVLSGFSKDISLAEMLKYPRPYADGYTGFWENTLTMQHPLASIEIVPWDGSLILIFSDRKSIVDNFIDKFPLSEYLSVYNAK